MIEILVFVFQLYYTDGCNTIVTNQDVIHLDRLLIHSVSLMAIKPTEKHVLQTTRDIN